MSLFSSLHDLAFLACPTCMAGGDDINSRAAGWSIAFLLAIILPVLGGLVRFAFHIRKTSRERGGTL